MSRFKNHNSFPNEKNLQTRLYPNVCFNYRKSFKKPFSDEPRLCPQCEGAMTRLSRKFSAPASNDLLQWKKIQFLVNHGFLFQSVYDKADGGSNIRYPATLEEAKDFVIAFKMQAVSR
jgi:hypothetical protein